MSHHQKAKKLEVFKPLWKFLAINFLIVGLLMVFFCPSCFLSLEGLASLGTDFIYSFLFSTTLSYGGFTIEAYFDKKISWIDNPIKRLLLTASTYLFYSFVISFILITIFVGIFNGVALSKINWLNVVEHTFLPVSIAFVITTVFTARSWLYEWRNAAIETEKLRTEKLAGQYQSLKDQLNPHFLFNSLNVLSGLVYENADKSAAFIQQLSKIYRYVLDIQQEELVSLHKEMRFAESYLSLQKIRFEDSLNFEIAIQSDANFYLPPLSLQLLLENAVKHNMASLEHPLQINITQEGKWLKIQNSYQPKNSSIEENSGIGLENIRKRYALLSDMTPLITQTEDTFIVALPLLEMVQKLNHDEQ